MWRIIFGIINTLAALSLTHAVISSQLINNVRRISAISSTTYHINNRHRASKTNGVTPAAEMLRINVTAAPALAILAKRVETAVSLHLNSSAWIISLASTKHADSSALMATDIHIATVMAAICGSNAMRLNQ